MKPQFIAIAAVLVLLPIAQNAYAESVPQWIKSNAGWWADGTISENEFVSGIQYLISENILAVPPTAVSSEKTEGMPDFLE